MPLVTGARLGAYEVLALIGQGGMGEVYRARDTKLDREVALKVLPETFTSDPERLARFEREAKVLASLNHPNIAAIYGLEEANGLKALVLELVEGATLADKLVPARGGLPLDESLGIARQIAVALEAAHEAGIIHRDLKPGNIAIRHDGVMKVLDFGLAKAFAVDGIDANTTNSPTLTLGATQAGVILGTAAYMSPEQARGHVADRRADIWSFGAVLYEMLAGHKAFPGDSVSDTLAAVIKLDPDWEALSAGTPPSIRTLVRRCLTKDSKQRLQAIGEARIALENPESSSVRPALAGSRVGLWAWATTGVCAVALAAVSLVHFSKQPPAPAPVRRFEIVLPDPRVGAAVVSPDGSKLVFFGGNSAGLTTAPGLFVRTLDSVATNFIPGTEGANGRPFWSPDSRYIAFSSRDRKLKKLDVTTGVVEVLCDATAAIGGFWTPDNTIVFSDNGKLTRVSANGGKTSPLWGSNEPGTFSSLPVLLPDGRHFIFSAFPQNGAAIYVALRDEPAGKLIKLVDGVIVDAIPSNTDPNLGYLLFLRGLTAGSGLSIGTLVAQRFDLRRLETMGEPALIRERVGLASASRTGVIVFATAPTERGDQLTIFDRQGKTLQTLGEPDEYSRVSFSPDGARIIAARGTGNAQQIQIWMFDLARGFASRFPTDPGGAFFPIWSPDGSRIVFASDRGGKRNLHRRLSNGGGEDEVLFTPDEDVVPLSWSGNGGFIGVGANAQEQTHFVITLDAKGLPNGKMRLFVRRRLGIGIEFSPEVARPPHWVSYQSTRDQRTEIYLREFDPNAPTLTPANAGEWQVSKGGGTSMRWNPNGKELFYLAPDRTVMSVEMTGNANAPTGLPKPLFKPAGIERASQAGIATFSWAVSPDGKRFLFPIPTLGDKPTPSLSVVLNWTSLLNQ